jgi:two-component system response regulator FixJ
MGQERKTILKVAVVDDDPAVREALLTMFETKGFRGQAYGRAEEFLAAAKTLQPDCLLLDAHLPVRSGLDVLEAIGGARYPAPIIMTAGRGDIPIAVAAIKAGAHDVVEKPFDASGLIERVQEAVCQHRERSRAGGRSPTPLTHPGSNTLTARETEVLTQIVKGASNKEMARLLGISPRTVEVHRARIMEKLAARNIVDLMRIVLSESSPV